MAQLDQKSLSGWREGLSITVHGRVQGVGFRPFVYRLSQALDLKGTVQNNMDGVHIHWEGQEETIRTGLNRLIDEKPAMARIDHVETVKTALSGASCFTIIPSDRSGCSSLIIPVDSAVCDDCLREMRDPANRRYHYPFINCTQCGPRYTIIDALPYDRSYTSMKNFIMCRPCADEYHHPADRRYHAQPIACASCGPHLSLLDPDGRTISEREQALRVAVRLLEKGKIVAIKGIGGYHLACDAANETAVARLRKRKGRPDKPLAVMVPTVEAAGKMAAVSDTEAAVLRSPEAPIVLLGKKDSPSLPIARGIAPGIRTVGIMLPYTPLHHLLFDMGRYSCLVMTSANHSGLPILYEDGQVLSGLKGIAEAILTHNRPIYNAIDDSVVRADGKAPFFLRRARGYAPEPVAAPGDVSGIVALGSQLNNTFALGRGHQIFISPHLGDLSSDQSIRHYERTLRRFIAWTGSRIETVAADLHPLYSNRETAAGLGQPVTEVQHHHAHLVSCMADNHLGGCCLGIILDGTGYGEDGAIWGFEVLYGGAAGFRRLAHLRYTPLPGGDRAVIEPWRNAAAMLISLHGDEGMQLAERLFPEKKQLLPVIQRMTEREVNSPSAGTCGRLFDAVSAILGVCRRSTYEGEAAVLLSELAESGKRAQSYPFTIREQDHMLVIDPSEMLQEIAVDHLRGAASEAISQRFHETVKAACCTVLNQIHRAHPEYGRRVVLSGGSFNNPYLSEQMDQTLCRSGFTVFRHQHVPCGDGGLSLGQLIIAEARRSSANR
ncbi:carbamoyltransferase HypF [Sporolactobacillus sp. Y61]|uniref:Carbamoyltransferase n=1 Tax=Sporolactobacillus sp. Y61 TaxID=3160863 RepID=A0AAU8IBW5_9BACL